jgi:hypothetical protein
LSGAITAAIRCCMSLLPNVMCIKCSNTIYLEHPEPAFIDTDNKLVTSGGLTSTEGVLPKSKYKFKSWGRRRTRDYSTNQIEADQEAREWAERHNATIISYHEKLPE